MRGRALLAAALIGVAVAPLAAEPLVSRPEAKDRAVQNEFEALFRQAMGPTPAPAIPALTALLSKVDNDHRRAVILSVRGAAYLGANDLVAAARDFDKAALLTPDHVPDQIRFSAGLGHKRFGQSAIALDHLLGHMLFKCHALQLAQRNHDSRQLARSASGTLRSKPQRRLY